MYRSAGWELHSNEADRSPDWRRRGGRAARPADRVLVWPGSPRPQVASSSAEEALAPEAFWA
eukprot:6208368-Alexandrium_andersonii.AAC.1